MYVCVLRCEENGARKQQVRSFGTMTKDLLALADWLKEEGVTHVAMEATSVYWRPVWAILEGQFHLLLVNPQHIKALPGRTDVKDCEWIADLPARLVTRQLRSAHCGSRSARSHTL